MKRIYLLLAWSIWLFSFACYLDPDIQCTSDKECLQNVFICCLPGMSCYPAKANRCVCPPARPNQVGEMCVDFASDRNHCGKANHRCDKNLVCRQGKCTADCCEKGEKPPCRLQACNGACVDYSNDPNNCGGCSAEDPKYQCKGRRICVKDKQGKPTCQCPPNHVVCNGVCVDTKTDPRNCGKCDNSCPAGVSCVAGRCGTCDKPPYKMCKNICVDTSTDIKNCGDCGIDCIAQKKGEACYKGQCIKLGTHDNCSKPNDKCLPEQECVEKKCTCKRGLVECAGKCVDLHTNRENCGSCGFACKNGESCSEGHCCKTGETYCSGTCVNTKMDLNHCGACNNPCNKACIDGHCKACSTDKQCPPHFQCQQGSCLCGKACLWAITEGAQTARSGYMKGKALVVDKNQNIYIIGTLKNKVAFGSRRLSAVDAAPFVAKLNPIGQVIWIEVFDGAGGPSHTDLGGAIALSKDEKYLAIAGTFASETISFGSKKLKNAKAGTRDIFVALLKADTGKVFWASSVGDVKDDEIGGVAFGPKGDIFLAGMLRGGSSPKVKVGSLTIRCDQASGSLFVAKIQRSSHKFLWALSPVGNKPIPSVAMAITVDNQGAAYVAGQIDDDWELNGKKLPNDKGSTGNDLLILKVKPDGSNFAWGYGTQGTASGRTLTLNPKNELFVAGAIQGAVRFPSITPIPPSNNAQTLFVLKLSSKGSPIWVASGLKKDSNDDLIQIASSIFYDSTSKTGRILLTGAFDKTITFDKKLTNPKIGSKNKLDAFVAILKDSSSQPTWLWSQHITGDGIEFPESITSDHRGNPYILGWFENNISFPNPKISYPSKSGQPFFDLFLYKTAP